MLTTQKIELFPHTIQKMNNAIKLILGRFCAALLCIFGISIYVNMGLFVEIYWPETNYKVTNCTETTCLLNVIGVKCYAKFEEYPDPNFYPVDCGSYKSGYYNLTVPCNTVDNEPTIICYKQRMSDDKYHGIRTMMMILSLGIAGILMALAIILFIETREKYAAPIISVPNGDKPPKQNFVELDDQNTNDVGNIDVNEEKINKV